jgi:hypothetical protein
MSLQLGNLLRNRGLGIAQIVGRLTEGTAADDGRQGREVPRVQIRCISLANGVVTSDRLI